MSSGIIDRSLYILSELGPRLVAGITFLPCGLLMGYIFVSFVLERDNLKFIRYGPFIFGIVCSFITAFVFYLMKLYKGRYVFIHFEILITAAIINLIGSGFFFAKNFDIVGAFLSYFGHGLTYITTLSYLHIISSRTTRSIFLSSCFVWYILGISSAISVIANNAYIDINQNFINNSNTSTTDIHSSGMYTGFAGLNIGCCTLVLILLIAVVVFDRYGSVEYKTCLEDEVRIANSNGTIFDERSDIIRRKQFFYVTKSLQWRVSLILIFTDAIYFGLFIYFMFWFSLNDAVRLTSTFAFGLMFWIILAGSFTGAMALFFFSVKMTFVVSSFAQIIFAVIGFIAFNTVGTLIPFWFNCFLFGATLASIKIALLETSHLKYTELLTSFSYFTQLIIISLIFMYFIADTKNSFFYSTNESTLVANGLCFLIIISLLTFLIGLQIPRTYKTPLFEIQYDILGIIFTKHQIEQLNMKWLNDGTIPTISRNSVNSVNTETNVNTTDDKF